MPTYEVLPRSTADLDRLSPEQQRRFRRAATEFVQDCAEAGTSVSASAKRASSRIPGGGNR
ncbi:hypothetical protein ACFVVJ_16850 [Streptomyces albidoflavus]|uniref:hypothetical protein n=1 Tax=Streptomyces albidoflavus TaxID=1886 RepID=UPI0020D1E9BF|nr:hypothetical protein [Streptomyces albidoflavus]